MATTVAADGHHGLIVDAAVTSGSGGRREFAAAGTELETLLEDVAHKWTKLSHFQVRSSYFLGAWIQWC